MLKSLQAISSKDSVLLFFYPRFFIKSKFVALIPVFAVFMPFFQAEPAEFMSTFAGHMHTAFIFLYRIFAFRACFGICQQPLVTIVNFKPFVPLNKKVTAQWPMAFSCAAKTPKIPAVANNIAKCFHRIFNSTATVRSRTPFHFRIAIDIGSDNKHLVAFKEFSR